MLLVALLAAAAGAADDYTQHNRRLKFELRARSSQWPKKLAESGSIPLDANSGTPALPVFEANDGTRYAVLIGTEHYRACGVPRNRNHDVVLDAWRNEVPPGASACVKGDIEAGYAQIECPETAGNFAADEHFALSEYGLVYAATVGSAAETARKTQVDAAETDPLRVSNEQWDAVTERVNTFDFSGLTLNKNTFLASWRNCVVRDGGGQTCSRGAPEADRLEVFKDLVASTGDDEDLRRAMVQAATKGPLRDAVIDAFVAEGPSGVPWEVVLDELRRAHPTCPFERPEDLGRLGVACKGLKGPSMGGAVGGIVRSLLDRNQKWSLMKEMAGQRASTSSETCSSETIRRRVGEMEILIKETFMPACFERFILRLGDRLEVSLIARSPEDAVRLQTEVTDAMVAFFQETTLAGETARHASCRSRTIPLAKELGFEICVSSKRWQAAKKELSAPIEGVVVAVEDTNAGAGACYTSLTPLFDVYAKQYRYLVQELWWYEGDEKREYVIWVQGAPCSGADDASSRAVPIELCAGLTG